MGLRPASVRHFRHLEDMAPALTKTLQRNLHLPNTFLRNSLTDAVGEKNLTGYPHMGDQETHKPVCLSVDDSIMGLQKNVKQMCVASGTPNVTGDCKLPNINDDKQVVNDLNLISGDAANFSSEINDFLQTAKCLENDGEMRLDDTERTDCSLDMRILVPSAEDDTNMDCQSNLGQSNREIQCNMYRNHLCSPIDKKEESLMLKSELKVKQSKLERRYEFLKRRLRKHHCSHMGSHLCENITHILDSFEKPGETSTARKKLCNFSFDDQKNNRLDCSIAVTDDDMLPSNSSKLYNHLSPYDSPNHLFPDVLGSNSFQGIKTDASCSTPGSTKTSIPSLYTATNYAQLSIHNPRLFQLAGTFGKRLEIVQSDVDCDATESSSGGDSCDELLNYNNQQQQFLSIERRALWKYLSSRAVIASKWSWFQAQITDLEYKIRKYSDVYKQIRLCKSTLRLPTNSGNIASSRSKISTNSTAWNSSKTNDVPLSASISAVNGYRNKLSISNSVNDAISSNVAPDGLDANVSKTFKHCSLNGSSFENGVGRSDSSGSADYVDSGSSLTESCARVRPVNVAHRKLVQLLGLHAVSIKAQRPSNVMCGCMVPLTSCAICTGRSDPMYPREPSETMSQSYRFATLDPTIHPVVNVTKGFTSELHCEAIMKQSEWQLRSTRLKCKFLKYERSDKTVLETLPPTKKREYRRKHRPLKSVTGTSVPTDNVFQTNSSKAKRARNSSGSYAQSKNPDGTSNDDDEVERMSSSMPHDSFPDSSSSPPNYAYSTHGQGKRNKYQSYDIDNIVIPYSIAASTRVEKLEYKEILTPKWRLVNVDIKRNGAMKQNMPSVFEYADEDLSDEAVMTRHERCEQEEKKRFLNFIRLPFSNYGRPRSHKRADSIAEHSGITTPESMSPHHQADISSDIPFHSGCATMPESAVQPSSSWYPASVDHGQCSLGHVDSELDRNMHGRQFPMSSTKLHDQSENGSSLNIREIVKDEMTCVEEVRAFETRNFPLTDESYQNMLDGVPQNYQFQINVKAQDFSGSGEYDVGCDVVSADSDSADSINGEDPNDPEWNEKVRVKGFKERTKRL